MPISNIMKNIIEEKNVHVTNKEVIEIDEEPVVTVLKSLVRSKTDKTKDKKQKVDTPKSAMKNVKQKTPMTSPVSKRRRIEEKNEEKKSLKRKRVQSSDSKNVEDDVQDIVPTIRRKVDGKRVLMNILVAP